MAYSLFGERPDTAAASSANLFQAFARWVADARAKRAQHVALSNLLDYDDAMLSDLGVNRGDVLAALSHSRGRAGRTLSARRAQSSRDWLSGR